MSSLRQAQVQRYYQPVVIAFFVLVLAVLGLALAFGNASATIAITPKGQPVTASFSTVIGPNASQKDQGIDGQVSVSTVSATVTAAPSATGSSVDAHATGNVVLHNDSSAAQPLVSGTRLQGTGGVIVRTTARTTVPAHGTVTIGVRADAVGVSGNLAAGRLTIVALHPGQQALIYGQVVTPLTGGTTTASGTLGLNDLTAASDQAKSKIRQQVGDDAPGHLHILVPSSVTTDPAATVPSSSYTVTVTMKHIDVTFAAADLDARLRKELTAVIAADQNLASVDQPDITAGDQPTATSIALAVAAKGTAVITADTSALSVGNFTHQDKATIVRKILAVDGVDSAVVTFSPAWRRSSPDQVSRIHLTIGKPATH